MLKNISYFIEKAQTKYPERKNLEGVLNTDILIVGSGMAGLSTAYALLNIVEPATITIIDSGRVGFSTTGLSSGLLVDNVEDNFYDANEGVYREIQMGLKGIVSTVEKENLLCDLKKVPSIYLATKKGHQTEMIKKEYEARKKANFNVDLLDKEKLWKLHGLKAELAMINKEGYCFDSVSFCQELTKVLESKGVKIYEQTKITGYNQRKKLAITSSGNINYKKIVLTNGFSPFEDNTLKEKVLLLSTAVAVTESLTTKQYKKIFSNGEYMGWDAPEYNYTYFRPAGEERILIGGADRLISMENMKKIAEDKSREKKYGEHIRKSFEKIFQNLKEVQFDYLWEGVIPAAIDSSPLIGEFAQDHYIGLYSPGLPYASRCGQIIAQLISGKVPESFSMFKYNRKMPLAKRIRALANHEPFTTLANSLYFS